MPVPGKNKPDREVSGLVEHLFRHQYGELVARLCSAFGPNRLELIEDVVQESLMQALRHWSFRGLPDDPQSWLMTVARNRAIDVFRQEQRRAKSSLAIEDALYQQFNMSRAGFRRELSDDVLRLMFVCCDDSLSGESQVAIILKMLCGFSVNEIARAFLTKPTTVAQRLTRAKKALKRIDIEQFNNSVFDSDRLESVLTAIYLVFNEGYNASSGDSLIRHELVAEAIRLVSMLAAHPAGDRPEVHALAALILLQAGRLPGRCDAEGNFVSLRDQDRERWNRNLISIGMKHLQLSAAGKRVSAYHLEAGIAACHVTAHSYESTNWEQILFYYNALIALNNSPLVALNRCVAIAEVHGDQAGLSELRESGLKYPQLSTYYLYHATLGELLGRCGDYENARVAYVAARDLTSSEPERRFLSRRIEECRWPGFGERM